jgi:hypothetical protein
MIHGFKKLSTQTPVVAQSCNILEELMKVVLNRELELILRPEEHDDKKSSGSESPEKKSNPSATNVMDLVPSCTPGPLSASKFETGPPQLVAHSEYESESTPRADTNIFDYNADQTAGVDAGISYRSFNDHANSTVSPEGFQSGQSYDFLEAEPDLGFNDAFDALEKGEYPSDSTYTAFF